ncbi:DUF1294 domain-containing protein [Noviherbaspirillum denitrificans]|uniref:DNA-binding protein n=1 Tax=Noviherbaspirillum denitrificans TaxID=1968433 RepID=A0A254TAY6_9BURK|nr:DUF1294 domain-containing protein [Noviherbaspirillum denitrificans]OWW19811.1 hypothetical protein AYR66_10165 [Noviherbaspirillum denitrificans]
MPITFALLFLSVLIAAGLAGAIPLAVAIFYSIASLVAMVVYGIDKSAARKQARRTPERTLHLLGLAGGWPGALVAQALFRHKTAKRSFRAMFWVTAIINCAALGALLLSARI